MLAFLLFKEIGLAPISSKSELVSIAALPMPNPHCYPLNRASRSRTVAAERILVVDDDKKTVATIKLYLENAGFDVSVAHDGRQALEAARAAPPDLVVLDLMLPLVSGMDVCRMVRAESDVPVIMLTARTTEDDKLRGLGLGADDYITKPFSPRELVARVRTVLRRAAPKPQPAPAKLQFGELTVDLERHQVRLRDRDISLTPAEFRLLESLARSPGRVFTRQELVQRAFGYNYEGLDRTIDAHIKNLRKKIEPDRLHPSRILTVHGVGYKFSAGSDDA
jgi:DNA-binding response OmpR family regulator